MPETANERHAATGGLVYRKKPVEIQAVQYNGHNALDIRLWAREAGQDIRARDGGLDIATLEGTMHADPGDWVIRGIAGEFYPCKPDIFDASYEPVGLE